MEGQNHTHFTITSNGTVFTISIMRKINEKYNIYIFSYKKIKLIFTLKTFSVALWQFVGKHGL